MRRGSTRTIRAAATAVILSLSVTGAVAVGGSGVASAQDVVTTQGYTIGDGPVTGATAVAQPDAAGDHCGLYGRLHHPDGARKRSDRHVVRPQSGHGVPGRQGGLHHHRQHPVVG